jgi:multiple sugar transport system ATP-binding protein
MRDLAATTTNDDGVPTWIEVIVRLDSSSRLDDGEQGELWLDTSRIHLFDPDSGERLRD